MHVCSPLALSHAADYHTSTHSIECVLPSKHSLVVVHAWLAPEVMLAMIDDIPCVARSTHVVLMLKCDF